MSVDKSSGTNCDQCLSMVQCCFTSAETIRLIRTGSPGRPPRINHSSWTLKAWPQHSTCIYCLLGLDLPKTNVHVIFRRDSFSRCRCCAGMTEYRERVFVVFGSRPTENKRSCYLSSWQFFPLSLLRWHGRTPWTCICCLWVSTYRKQFFVVLSRVATAHSTEKITFLLQYLCLINLWPTPPLSQGSPSLWAKHVKHVPHETFQCQTIVYVGVGHPRVPRQPRRNEICLCVWINVLLVVRFCLCFLKFVVGLLLPAPLPIQCVCVCVW